LSVDLTVPPLVAHIYDETGTDEDTRETLSRLIEKRDRDAIAAQGGDAAKLIVALMANKDGFNKIALPKNARADMDRILTVAGELQSALNVYGLNDVQITIDPLERRGFEYQTGVSFTLFAIGARGEIGRGGRYDVAAQGKAAETATGFTLYMDTILRVIPPIAEPRRQSVSADASWEDVKALQDQGVQVERRG
jgi:ATP phosphoribosyltransferase regulatory subunit